MLTIDDMKKDPILRMWVPAECWKSEEEKKATLEEADKTARAIFGFGCK